MPQLHQHLYQRWGCENALLYSPEESPLRQNLFPESVFFSQCWNISLYIISDSLILSTDLSSYFWLLMYGDVHKGETSEDKWVINATRRKCTWV